jgi:hypothetical protein
MHWFDSPRGCYLGRGQLGEGHGQSTASEVSASQYCRSKIMTMHAIQDVHTVGDAH